jgi:protein SCO1
VCPTTMAEMASWFETLGDEGKDLRAYFVSVDPERDTPAVLGDYVSWVSDRITGITGSPDQVARIAKSWGVFYEKVPLDGGGYTMDHTASVFLLDSNGEFEGTIAYGEDQATALGKLRNLLAKS